MSYKNSIKKSSFGAMPFNESEINKPHPKIPTHSPTFNIALTGTVDEGIRPGIVTIAGESARFKTLLGLIGVKAYMDFYPDSILKFYDSERGASVSYFKNVGIDTDRIDYEPTKSIEILSASIVEYSEGLGAEDRAIIFVDSLGNIPSRKAFEDIRDDKKKHKPPIDLTSAKGLKTLYKHIINALHLRKDYGVPMIQIAHTYQSIGDVFPKTVISGGQAIRLSSDTAIIMRDSQLKEGTEKVGRNFGMYIDKSRYIVDKCTLPLHIKTNSGLEKYGGMIEMAMELECVTKRAGGRKGNIYEISGDIDKKEYNKHGVLLSAFWDEVYKKTDFKEKIKCAYQLEKRRLLNNDYEDSANLPENELVLEEGKEIDAE